MKKEEERKRWDYMHNKTVIFFLSSEIGMYIEYVMEYAYTHTFFFFSKWGNNTVQE